MSALIELILAGVSTSGVISAVLRLWISGAQEANRRILRRGQQSVSIKVKSSDGSELTVVSDSVSKAATFLRNYLDEEQEPTASGEVESD